MSHDDVKVHRIAAVDWKQLPQWITRGRSKQKAYTFVVNDAIITFVNPPQKKVPSDATVEVWWRNLTARYGVSIVGAFLHWDENGAIGEAVDYGR